ncbi:MAG: type IV pilus modification protein PilV [Pseudomonadota bacterium]
MVNTNTAQNLHAERGTSMIEVLVTIVILSFGLLGLAGLQSRVQVSEIEAYQRAQALLLLEDMANRVASNRNAAATYVTDPAAPLGVGNSCSASSTASRQVQDSCEWSKALLGAGEVSGTNNVGAMTGGRGCVKSLGSGEYLITVAWQGIWPIPASASRTDCGQDAYNGTGSACVNDLCRRTLSTIVRIATLI